MVMGRAIFRVSTCFTREVPQYLTCIRAAILSLSSKNKGFVNSMLRFMVMAREITSTRIPGFPGRQVLHVEGGHEDMIARLHTGQGDDIVGRSGPPQSSASRASAPR